MDWSEPPKWAGVPPRKSPLGPFGPFHGGLWASAGSRGCRTPQSPPRSSPRSRRTRAASTRLNSPRRAQSALRRSPNRRHRAAGAWSTADLTSRIERKLDRPVRRGGSEGPPRAPTVPVLSYSHMIFSYYENGIFAWSGLRPRLWKRVYAGPVNGPYERQYYTEPTPQRNPSMPALQLPCLPDAPGIWCAPQCMMEKFWSWILRGDSKDSNK